MVRVVLRHIVQWRHSHPERCNHLDRCVNDGFDYRCRIHDDRIGYDFFRDFSLRCLYHKPDFFDHRLLQHRL